jgi:hypothetical protein
MLARKPQIPKITKEDKQLAEAAKEKAGGAAALARLFGVTAPAASEWGRIRPIPRHLRPRIEDYLGLGARTRAERAHEALASHRRVLERIQDLLLVEMPGLDKLPPGYREQYRERVKEIEIRLEANFAEIAARIERELTDVRARLIAEYRAQRRMPT